jgi:hypothetical protein
MTTVFLSGSRKINRLNDVIRGRIQNIVDQGFRVVVGDANGADKAMQSFLSEKIYPNVFVYCAGQTCRNNMGSWEIEKVSVDPKLKGRAFYTQKDKVMAYVADYGLILWDGKSAGSINNVFELLKNGKKAVVYFSPRKEFFSVKTVEDIEALLRYCDPSVSRDFLGSPILKRQMESLNIADQHSFDM